MFHITDTITASGRCTAAYRSGWRLLVQNVNIVSVQPVIPIRNLKPGLGSCVFCLILFFFCKCRKILHAHPHPHTPKIFFRASEYLQPCLQLAGLGFFKDDYLCLGTAWFESDGTHETSENRDLWEGSWGRTAGRAAHTSKALGAL